MSNWKAMLRRVLLASFCGACLGVLALLTMFHAPLVNVPIFYFTTRPAFVWFGMLLPFLLVGAPALRRRWFILGCAFWVVGFLACEDSLAWVRPFQESARAKFETSQMAYNSFSQAHDSDVAVLDVPLRIVSWNMDAGRLGAAQLIAQLAALQPDVVFIEEFGEDVHVALKASEYFREFHFGQAYSVAILSRFPITAGKGALIPWTSGVWQVQLAPDRRITCVVVHLSAPDLKTQLLRGWSWKGLRTALDRRRHQLEKVREMLGLQVDGSPVLLDGDFNVPSHYPDIAIAAAGMKDAFAAKGFGWGKTAPAVFRAARPDMIFLPHDATVFDAFAVPTRNSDHCPVVAEVSIPVPRLKPLPGRDQGSAPGPAVAKH